MAGTPKRECATPRVRAISELRPQSLAQRWRLSDNYLEAENVLRLLEQLVHPPWSGNIYGGGRLLEGSVIGGSTVYDRWEALQ